MFVNILFCVSSFKTHNTRTTTQINLATRQATKPNNTNVTYPSLHSHRPGSAQAGCRLRNNLFASKETQRPASADTSSYKNTNDLRKKRPSSSSNILKLLLAEPVKKRYWSSSSPFDCDQDGKSDVSLGTKIQNQARHEQMRNDDNDSPDDNSEVEEEINEEIDGDEKTGENDDGAITVGEIKFGEGREVKITTKPPIPLGKKLPKFGLPLSTNNLTAKSENNYVSLNEQFVKTLRTNSNSSNIRPSDNKFKLSSWFDEKLAKNRVVDLPGRVSFSKSDVLVLNYSDNENSDEERNASSSHKKTVHFSEETVNVPPPLSVSVASQNSESSFNSFVSKRSENSNLKINTEKSDNMKSQTDQIIEDYKREIENLNRQHEIDLQNVQSYQTTDFTEYYKTEMSETTSKINVDLERSSEKQLSTVKEGNDLIKEFYDAVDSIPPPISPNVSEEYSDVKWNNTNMPQNNFHKFPENSEEVIQNYLSVKDEQFLGSNDENFSNTNDTNIMSEKMKPHSPSKTSPKKHSKPVRKLKSAAPSQHHNQPSNNRPATSKPSNKTMKKAKSLACLRDNTVLDEFQIDKIESWMSMHDDLLSERDEGLHHHHHHHHHQHRHQLDWNQTPTSSKTDDEGNFSLDDHIDINSGTESTYDEIVEIIKEIDSEKLKSHEDLKNIKKSVELKLKKLMSSNGESSDSAVSEDKQSDESNDKMK